MCSLREKNFILELIEAYHALPGLWDIRNPVYTNRKLKKHQYNILLQKYREVHPNAVKKDLAKRLNSLRTNFRREFHRVNNGENQEAEEPNKPTLFYYEALSFLIPVLSTCCSNNSFDVSTQTRRINKVTEIDRTNRIDQQQQQQPEPKKIKPNSADKIEQLPTERVTATPETYQQMGNIWGHKVSKMDRMQRIIAERVINEVMFNGELGLLNTNTGLTNVGQMYETHFSPTLTEPKDEIMTIESSNIFGE